MPGPCPLALSLSRIPSRKWDTRADLAERLDFVRQVIENNPATPLDVAALARLAALSEHHFIRTFHKAYGLSPIRYRQRERLRFARRRIESGDSVYEACLRSGFNSFPTFCRAFRSEFGQTPGSLKIRSVY